MTKKELALKTVAELRDLAAGYGHKLAARVKSGIVDELSSVIQQASKDLKKRAKKTSKETARTVRAVKKALAAGKKAAASTRKSITKKKATGSSKTTAKSSDGRSVKKSAEAVTKTVRTKKRTTASSKAVKAKPSTKPAENKPSASVSLELKKKDLQGMTVTGLKAIARSFGLKQSYANKEEFVTALAKDLTKLRAEARKKPSKPAAKKVVKPVTRTATKPVKKETAKPASKKAVKPAAKKVAVKKKIQAATKEKPVKQATKKVEKPSAPSEGRVAGMVKPAVHALVEKARELAAQVREKVAPSIRPAKPKKAKKKKSVLRNGELHGISMPHVASVLQGEESAAPAVELLVAIAVEPTELFISWVLDSKRMLSGRLVLRVLEEGGGHFDTPVDGLSGSLYVRALPGRHYQVSVGIVDSNGVFTVFRRSNTVATPPGDVQPLGKQKKGEGPLLPETFYNFTPQEYGSH